MPAGEQLRLAVRITPHGAALRADVTFLAAGKPPVLRKIESPDCDDAVDALALVVAIGIDERWRERAAAPRLPARPTRRHPARRRPSPPVSEPEPEPLLDSGETSVTLAPSTLSVPLPAPEPAPPSAPPPAARPPAPLELAPAWSWAGGVSARWLQGAAPEPLVGGELWLRASWERGSILSPDFGVSVAHDRAGGFQRPEGSADFALSAVDAEVCPLRFGVAALRLQPCVSSTLGWLRSSGRRTFRAHSVASPWWTLGAGVQVMASIGDLALRATGGAAHPFERSGYRFHSLACAAEDCDEPAFHRVAPVVWSTGVGAGVSF